MVEKMIKLILLFLLFINVSVNVEGKAVGRKKVFPGYDYSPIKPTKTLHISPEQKKHWYKNTAASTNDQQSYASSSKYAEKSDLSHHSDSNDLESYENLQLMLDSEFLQQDLQNSKQRKPHEEKLNSNIPKWKENDSFLEGDQVFMHREKNERSKYNNHNVKQDLSENYSIGNPKREKSKASVSTIHSKKNSDFHKTKLNSTVSPSQLESKYLSDHLNYESIPSELIHDSGESLKLNQINLPEDESYLLNNFESIDSKLEDKETPDSGNSASSLRSNQLSNKEFNTLINPEDKKLFKTGINRIFQNDFNSFVFNPSAQPLEKFQECKTPKNETGFCRYVQHCMLQNILNSIEHFMQNVCIIEGRFIGVCCPEFPVQKVRVKWEDQSEQFNDNNNSVEIPRDCGIGTNTRIVGGNDADRKAWPWMVALLNNKKKFFCGGSLINNQYVLTAAHCTFGASKDQIVARLGEYDFNDPREPHDDYRVTEIKRHGQYNSMTLRNDIALLKLEKPVVFNEFVKTICFPEVAKDFIGNMTTLVGWGNTNGDSGGTAEVLQEASFPVISNPECSSTHGIPIPSSLICAAAVSRDQGACNGDSGGPLMLLGENDRWKVIGLVSWGRRGCNPKFPTVYTRVTHFMDWIRKHST